MEKARKILTLAYDASGAYQAALAGQVVLIVDVIDMGTTLESAIQKGAQIVLGASPVPYKAPVPVDPVAIGMYAARLAKEFETGIVLVSEPRVGSDEDRLKRASGVINGIARNGLCPEGIYPNLGAETAKLVNFDNKIVVAVSDCGGTAFDAAFNAGAPVFTGTVARTFGYSGWQNADAAVERVVSAAEKEERGICIVASSSKSLEDVLAAQFLVHRVLEKGQFLFR